MVLMKKFFALLLIFTHVFCGQIFSMEMDFPIAGLLTVSDEAVKVRAEWQDSWFFESPFKYNHGLARIAAIFSEISYIDVNGNPDGNILKSTYRSLGVKDSDMEFHYDIDYSLPVYGINQTAFSIASKEINGPGGKRTLVFLVIRGTPYEASEWISNLDVMDGNLSQSHIHDGFSKCVEQIHGSLIYYLLKHRINPERTTFFITGHSRGAAASSLMGDKLISEGVFRPENIFVYTFACPNFLQQEEKLDPDKYGFIWNIINAEDAVPSLPPCRGNWHFQKFGRSKTIVNRWNVDKNLYDQVYIPKMNAYYKKFLGREYSPFKNGPFVQTQFSRIVTDSFNTIEDYYKNIFNIPQITKNMVKSIFPKGKETHPGKYVEGENWFLDFLNNITDHSIESISLSLTDMHACEMYLAWILALDEKEVFSELGSYQIVMDGFYECAVFDENENLVAQILDGAIQYEKISLPVAASPILGKKLAVGLPANEDFKIVIHKQSLAPTVISLQLERYDSNGVLVSTEEKTNVFAHIGMGLEFCGGKVFDSDPKICMEKIHGKELGKYIDAGGLEQQEKFFVYPELSFDLDRQMGIGIHVGNPNIYLSLLTVQPLNNFGSVAELSPGVGHQNAVFANIMLDLEFYTRLIYVFPDVKGHGWNFVPSLRCSLSFKPRNYVQYFVAGTFDFHIGGFNDGPFSPQIRDHLGGINLDTPFQIVPSLSFGLKI